MPCCQFRAVIEGSSPPIVVTKDIYIGTVPLCLRDTTTRGPCSSSSGTTVGLRHYVTTYDQLAADYDDNYDDDNVTVGYSSYSPPCGVSRLSLVDFIAATAVQVPGPTVTGPSAPVMSTPVLHAPPPDGPPPYEARPPPFAPGHDDTSAGTERQRTSSSTESQQLQSPRESF